MLGTILIIFWIMCISTIIYVIKNYSFIQQKIKENLLFQGIVCGGIIIIVILLISFTIMYGMVALDNFGIIDASNYIE